MSTQTVPHEPAAERSVLGSMMLTPDAMLDGLRLLEPALFYVPKHQQVFAAIRAVNDADVPVDPVSVAAEMKRCGDDRDAGGLLLGLLSEGSTTVAHHAALVADAATRRHLAAIGRDMAAAALSGEGEVRSLVDEAEQSVFALAEGREQGSTKTVGEMIGPTLDWFEELQERTDSVTGTPSGFIDLDDTTLGFQPGALVVVGARPAMGKTSFALNCAAHAASEGRPVLVVSLEMSNREMTQRLLCTEAQVDSMRIQKGKANEADWAKLTIGMGHIHEWPIWLDDDARASVLDIRSKARRMKAEHGDLGLVVVDYLQLMTGRASAENRQVAVSEISRGLKILARELECPVMALSQLSRGLEQRTDKRPMLADLRESGAVEQDADVVMFLYRDEVYHPDTADKGQAEVLIAKHRAGPTGAVRLAWIGRQTRFANMARGQA